MEIKIVARTATRTHPILSQSPVIKFFTPAMRFGSQYAPRLAGWLGFQLLCRPKKRRFSRSENVILAQAWQWQIIFEGKPIQLYSWGEGPTVLFVHGWAANAGTWRHYIGSLVESGYRIVAFDAPAHGRSDGKILTPVQYMRAIKAVQEDIGDTYAVVSHSVGALSTLLSFDNQVKTNSKNKLILPEKLVLLSPFGSIMEMYDYIIDCLGLPASISKTIREYGIQSLGKKAIAMSALETVKQFCQTELMLVHDTQDPIAAFDTSENIAIQRPNTIFLKTSGLGHALRHEEVVKRVISFIGQ